ncbi:MAG TPA: fibronectin type III-like domain-contianing protein [Terriglobia bacterium]|nr:fibronectin type III-like domain-contianing protein [Terriglobia bacterium]
MKSPTYFSTEGIKRAKLIAGETGHIHLGLDGGSISYWDATKYDWAIMPGNHQVMVGASPRDIWLQDELSVN